MISLFWAVQTTNKNISLWLLGDWRKIERWVYTCENGIHVRKWNKAHKQRVLMHGHQGWNVRHGLCHIYMRYLYIWVVYNLCFFCCLFITVTWWYVWCIEWASGNQEEVQACLVTLWLFIISCYSLYKTTLGFVMLIIWKKSTFS